MRTVTMTLVAALLPSACQDSAEAGGVSSSSSSSAGESGEPTTGTDPSSGSDDGYDIPAPEPLPPGTCQPGAAGPCTCDGGGSGERLCLPDGEWSACGCAGGDGVYEPPPAPVYEYCGDVACKPYPFPHSDYAAQHCCGKDTNACGSTNENLFEGGKMICLERFHEPGVRSPDCPDESIAFIDFLGCCLPSGTCGMSLDETMPNWDVGCIERVEWKPMLDGLSTRFFAAIAFGFDPAVPDWQPIACAPE